MLINEFSYEILFKTAVIEAYEDRYQLFAGQTLLKTLKSNKNYYGKPVQSFADQKTFKCNLNSQCFFGNFIKGNS